MTLTLLVDLDDTLLDNDINAFLPNYLQALSKHLAAHFPAEILSRELMAGTYQMLKNTNPGLTLEKVFSQAFYPALGVDREEIRAEIDLFYDEIFPTLQPLTSPRPEAVRMVEKAFSRGYQVVVATNPLFPLKAIRHRLAWAGLSPEQYPFALISSYETFHFTKPNPAYYAEVLAQLGWLDQPAIMVGNNLTDDIQPAARLGLPTFLLESDNRFDRDDNSLSSYGKLEEIMPWASRVANTGSQSLPCTPVALLAQLRSTPAALDTMTTHPPDGFWSYQPAPGEWNNTQILCHLRDVDREVNEPRLEKLTKEENPLLVGINTDPWADERDYAQQDGPSAVQEFIASRTRLIHLLEGLRANEWQKQARHTIFGPTHLSELVGFITTHDRNHVQQIKRNIKA